MQMLKANFFTADPVECARNLIGATFEWKGCAGKIVETEAYHAEGDEACHTFFRPSARIFVDQHQAGDAYVYINYGMHWLFNILVKGPAGNGFVLIRAVEPSVGIETMRERRGSVHHKLLAAGPGRFTKAFGISGDNHGAEFLSSNTCCIILAKNSNVIAGPRIGISKATDLLWRFGDPDSQCLSRKF